MFRKALLCVAMASGLLLCGADNADARGRRCYRGYCQPCYKTPAVQHVEVAPVQAVQLPPVTYDRQLVPKCIKVRCGLFCWKEKTVYVEKLTPRAMVDAADVGDGA